MHLTYWLFFHQRNNREIVFRYHQNPSENGTATKTITLIELNDLHANLVPHWDQKHPVTGTTVTLAKRGGLARIAVKVKEI